MVQAISQRFRGNHFKFNDYNPCVANKIGPSVYKDNRGRRDDLKERVSVNPKVNDRFFEWPNDEYGEHGEVKLSVVSTMTS